MRLHLLIAAAALAAGAAASAPASQAASPAAATAADSPSSPAADSAAPDSAAPDLQLRVSIEQGALRAGDRTRLDIWILNPSAREVPGVSLDVQAPAFLAVLDSGCTRRTPLPLPLKPFAPGELRALSLCLRAGDDANRIREGEAKLSVLLYATGSWGRQRARWVPADQTVKVGLFGTDEVAGVSLSLIALFVPGAVLLALLRVSHPRSLDWLAELAEVEQALLAILLSLLLAWTRTAGGHGLIGYHDFFVLTGMGAGIGIVLRLAFEWVDYVRSRPERLVPVKGELLQTTVRKLVEQAGVANPRSVIETDAHEQVVGSLTAKSADGDWVVIGRYRVVPGRFGEEVARAAEAGQLALARLDEKRKLHLDREDTLYDLDGNSLGDALRWVKGSPTARNAAGEGRGDVLVV
jgi:hypothetical protein